MFSYLSWNTQNLNPRNTKLILLFAKFAKFKSHEIFENLAFTNQRKFKPGKIKSLKVFGENQTFIHLFQQFISSYFLDLSLSLASYHHENSFYCLILVANSNIHTSLIWVIFGPYLTCFWR